MGGCGKAAGDRNKKAGLYSWERYQFRYATETITRRVKEEVGLDNIKTVVTGGLGRIISNETDSIDIYDPNLTLKGIYRVYKKQNRKTS